MKSLHQNFREFSPIPIFSYWTDKQQIVNKLLKFKAAERIKHSLTL